MDKNVRKRSIRIHDTIRVQQMITKFGAFNSQKSIYDIVRSFEITMMRTQGRIGDGEAISFVITEAAGGRMDPIYYVGYI